MSQYGSHLVAKFGRVVFTVYIYSISQYIFTTLQIKGWAVVFNINDNHGNSFILLEIKLRGNPWVVCRGGGLCIPIDQRRSSDVIDFVMWWSLTLYPSPCSLLGLCWGKLPSPPWSPWLQWRCDVGLCSFWLRLWPPVSHWSPVEGNSTESREAHLR